MTETVGALAPLATLPGAARDAAFASFYERAKANKEALVINKWFAMQASADVPGALDGVKALLKHEAFEATNPNRYRAVVNTFAGANPAHFHAADGSGYEPQPLPRRRQHVRGRQPRALPRGRRLGLRVRRGRDDRDGRAQPAGGGAPRRLVQPVEEV